MESLEINQKLEKKKSRKMSKPFKLNMERLLVSSIVPGDELVGSDLKEKLRAEK